MKPAFKTFVALVVTVVFVSLSASAQGGGGELTGIVQDPTGAVIPGATVLVTNVATGVTRRTTTTEAGVYRFPSLPVASYTLSVEVPGFRRMEVTAIRMSTGLTITQDIQMEVGAIAETVTVEAGGVELVQTTESQISGVIDSTVWEQIPLEFRNQNEFINLLPAVVPDDFAGSTRGAAVAGARGGTGNFMVEGFDNNDQGQGGRGAIVSGAITAISPEAIEEYRVIQQNYSAQYGKGGGFVTDTVLKSGSNEIHGSAFIYNRVQKLAANSFFSNREGLEDARIRNQFGASLGGPVVRDKTFVYGSWETHLFRESTPATGRAVTQEFLDFVGSGAFAAFAESDPNGVCNNQVFVDGYAAIFAIPPGVIPAAPCPGAFSNSSSLGPIFQALQASGQNFPLGNSAVNPSFDHSGLLGLFGIPLTYPVPIFGDVSQINKSSFNENRVSLKVDHYVSDKDSFHGTFLFEDSDARDSIFGSDVLIGQAIDSIGRSVLIGLTHTHTFTPTVINQFRIGFLRHTRDFPNPPELENAPSIISFFDELNTGFGQTAALPQFFTDNQFQYKDDLAWTVGKHSFKAGGEYRRTRNGSAFEAESNGVFWHNDTENLLTDASFMDEVDFALTNMIFGVPFPIFGGFIIMETAVDPTTGTFPEFYRGFRANEMAAYIQDDWRVSPRLTINIGLRYEYFGVPHNFRDGLDSNFYFGVPLTPFSSSSVNPFFPFNSPAHARVATGQFEQRDEGIWNKDTNNFAPRLGFAFDVTGEKTFVIRGGGGVFYDRIWNNLFENIRFNPPFFCFCGFGTFINGVPAGGLSSPGIYTDNFTDPSPFVDPTLLPVLPTPSPRHMDQDLVSAYWQQYFLGTQWRFQPDFVLEINGVSTLGRKLHGIVNVNTFNGRTRGDTTRPNPNIGNDNFRTNAFKSNYYGLQVMVRKRFSHGLQFQSNYTWSHAIDEVSDAFNNRGGLRPRNNFDIELDRANADFDIRHRFVTSYYYELPFWKNHSVLGGWSVSGIFVTQVGRPQVIFDGAVDANADGHFTDAPIFTGSGDINDAVINDQSPADGYLDDTQFESLQTDGSSCANGVVLSSSQWWCDGLIGRNTLIGPGFINADFSVQKRFLIGERFSVEFQANFFNIANHPNFEIPISAGNIQSGQFMRATDAFDPRITQFALRLDW